MRKVISLISSASCPNSWSLDNQCFYTFKVFRMRLLPMTTTWVPRSTLLHLEPVVLQAVREDSSKWQEELSTKEVKTSGLTYKRVTVLILPALSKFRPPASYVFYSGPSMLFSICCSAQQHDPDHEPGPDDPPGPRLGFESYGSSFGNFGPLPNGNNGWNEQVCSSSLYTAHQKLILVKFGRERLLRPLESHCQRLKLAQ